MLAVVKTPRIRIRIEGAIPKRILGVLRNEYGGKLQVDDDRDYTNVFETSAYKKAKKEMRPGTYIKIYRENLDLTQERLGKKLGVSKSYICDLEKGRRGTSKQMAKKLSDILGISMIRFLE